MKHFQWDNAKNEWLIRERGISFEVVVWAIENGKVLDVVDHPNTVKYGNQKMFVIQLNDYAHLVPFVEDKDVIFLKTVIPNRKATQKYLKGGTCEGA